MRAAQYLRMSTEHQNYSLTYQSAHNGEYALANGFEVVRDYVDAGISGITLKGRDGLRQLLADVVSGAADYEAVLVYDVSRWGRFQDPDQAAHYEFLCKEAGVRVIYTAEPFMADGGLIGSIVKQLRRAMAADYSRDLSDKVGRAKRGLRGEGYWVGGTPGYGLRRLAVAPDGSPWGAMEQGERKALRGYRTIIVPGPPAEVKVIRRIFRECTARRSTAEIAAGLNRDRIPAVDGALWSGDRVRRILRDEKYAGVLVYGKATYRFGARVGRRREDWVRVTDALPALVSHATFKAAQENFRVIRRPMVPDAELLDELRLVLADKGRLSADIIKRHPVAHCAAVFQARFGGLMKAYELIGYTPSVRQVRAADKALQHQPWSNRPSVPLYDVDEAWKRLEMHLAARGQVTCETINDDPDLPSVEWFRSHFGPMPEIYRRLGYTPRPEQQRKLRGERRAAAEAIYRPPRSDAPRP
jgi:DNA invertase Pin-like site-specific DNA recombinase